MNCAECKEILVAYFEGLVAEDQKHAVAEHLKDCHLCCHLCQAKVKRQTNLQECLVCIGRAAAQSDHENEFLNRIIREQNVRLKASNKEHYEAKDTVRFFSECKELQKPEATILRDLMDELKNMKMLDIGVGCGRTTYHFASVVREYVGIDYSVNMINSCEKRISCFPNNVSFIILPKNWAHD